jgi:hypothetical protein
VAAPNAWASFSTDHDIGAPLSKLQDDGAADISTRSGDQHGLAVEIEFPFHVPLFFCPSARTASRVLGAGN